MLDTSSGCMVSPLTECNHTTRSHDNATEDETLLQPLDLISLSIKVLERSKRNHIWNSLVATGVESKSCTVAFCNGVNSATEQIYLYIKCISDQYGGDDPVFLQQYIDDVLNTWGHDLDKAAACFKEVVEQLPAKCRIITGE